MGEKLFTGEGGDGTGSRGLDGGVFIDNFGRVVSVDAGR